MAELLVIDTVKPKKHSLSPHKVEVVGRLTPELFKRLVISAFNSAGSTGNASIIYSANKTPEGGLKLIAKLYQAKRNKTGKKRYTTFSTFHVPDGENLREKAKLSPYIFERSAERYPSRPPIRSNTNLRKSVRRVNI